MYQLAGKVSGLGHVSINTGVDATLVAARTGYRVRVLGLHVEGTVGTLTIEDSDGGRLIHVPDTNKFELPVHELGWTETPDDKGLQVDMSGTGQVDGNLVYCYVKV